MPVQFTCSKCNETIRVSSKYAGKRGRCPKCTSVVDVPTEVAAGLTSDEMPGIGSVDVEDSREDSKEESGPVARAASGRQRSRGKNEGPNPIAIGLVVLLFLGAIAGIGWFLHEQLKPERQVLDEAFASGRADALEKYLSRFPKGNFRDEATDELLWRRSAGKRNLDYLLKFPKGRHHAEAKNRFTKELTFDPARPYAKALAEIAERAHLKDDVVKIAFSGDAARYGKLVLEHLRAGYDKVGFQIAEAPDAELRCQLAVAAVEGKDRLTLTFTATGLNHQLSVDASDGKTAERLTETLGNDLAFPW